MVNLDTKNCSSSSNTHTDKSFTSLLSFKPRQVLLAQHNPTTTITASASGLKDENSTKIALTTSEIKATLHQLILDYFHRHKFSKTLKRFHSEAQIQTDAWKASSLHLEDIFSTRNACDVDSNNNTSKKPGNDEVMEKEKVCPTSNGTTTKKKKKTRYDLFPSTEDALNGLKVDDLSHLTKKIKDKKKKDAEKIKVEPFTTNENELVTEIAQKEKKKKKKSSADENETIQPEIPSGTRPNSKEEKSIKEEISAQETSNNQLDGETNVKLETDGVKSKKKQRHATVKPKTVNAFQRVKIDEVEFAHDKLQDNSYWAKDGAEIGYGAKAQEVLGQVRGRDFWHEKTKKKRGSYRGGLIDQESHSIKFTYSDEI
ncbi:hypothetical protein QVD17_11951 [Tagetes erecta]|uniref:Srp40 C-terminal domain-containing protein n=1 Tax=Tagetes erecta TaxID=13708 RepID=A0AAD8KVD4_TARER|nr:hypothetical protein QVD17_11951 [Tagetes erecta]